MVPWTETQMQDDNHSAASLTSCRPLIAPCLLPLLQPIRQCLHSFLTGMDAVRLLRAGRSVTVPLLADYPFLDVIFRYGYCSVDDIQRSLALYAHYRMRITHIVWSGPLVDSETGRPFLPPSLLALSLGEEYGLAELWPNTSTDYATVGSTCQQHRGAELQQSAGKEEKVEEGVEQLDRRLEQWEQDNCCDLWDVLDCASTSGDFNKPIPPGVLPLGLRVLQLGHHFERPLEVGSIPDSVEVLQFGACFHQRLLPGELPAGLRRLHLGHSFNQPITGILPPRLQHLSLGFCFSQLIPPGAIPPSVTHLRLSSYFNHPLLPGSIPHGITVLHLGECFNQPLAPGVLPTSLRELVLSRCYTQPLQPGSLPRGLEVLAFSQSANFPHPLLPGVVPASVRAVSLSKDYEQQLVPGGIPATVRWLRLPLSFAEQDLSGLLSPSTRIVHWQTELHRMPNGEICNYVRRTRK